MKRTFSILFAVLMLLIATQLMNGTLSLLTFERQQLTTMLSAYDAVGANIVAKLERAIRLGKYLHNFIGIEDVLKEGSRAGQDITNVCITSPNGEILASLQASPLPPVGTDENKSSTLVNAGHKRVGNDHFYFLPITAGTGQPVGFLTFAFSEQVLLEKRLSIVAKSLEVLGLCTLVAVFVLILGLHFLLGDGKKEQNRPVVWLLFLVLGTSQLVCSGYNFQLFHNDYLELIRGKTYTVARLLQQDVETLLQRGLQITTLLKMERQLESTVERVPEIEYLFIENNEGKVLYHGGVDVKRPGAQVDYLDLTGRQGVVGRIGIVLNGGYVKSAVREIALDSLTIVALSMLFIMELVIFLSATLLRLPNSTLEQEGTVADQGALARTAIFIFIFAASLCYSFIPLHMAELYRPIPGLTREMVLGLPIALEMFGGGLVLIPVGWWIDKKGWHQPFLLGTGLAMIGTAASGLFGDQIGFVAARFLAGIGYGMAWMSAQGYVLQNTDLKHRAKGISTVVAGIFSGFICGNGMGALLAERLGFVQVFFIGTGLMAVVILFALLFLRRAFKAPSLAVDGGKKRPRLLRLFQDKQILLLFLCSLIPYSIGMVGLLYYVTPLYLKTLGTSQSDIGRVIMLFGLCMIFIAPRFSRFADRYQDKRILVIGGGVLASASLLLFHLSSSFWIVPGAVLLFGVSVSISGPSRNVITLALPIAKELGTSQVMGVYRSIDKLGQTLGAMVPATLMISYDIRSAMLIMGGGYLLLTILLLIGLRPQAEV